MWQSNRIEFNWLCRMEFCRPFQNCSISIKNQNQMDLLPSVDRWNRRYRIHHSCNNKYKQTMHICFSDSVKGLSNVIFQWKCHKIVYATVIFGTNVPASREKWMPSWMRGESGDAEALNWMINMETKYSILIEMS